jgi:hypothetical protein
MRKCRCVYMSVRMCMRTFVYPNVRNTYVCAMQVCLSEAGEYIS